MTTPPLTPPAAKESQDRSAVAPWWHTILFLAGMLTYGIWEWHHRPQLQGGYFHSRLALYALTIGFEFFLLSYVWFLGLWLAGKKLRDIIGGKWATFGDFAMDVGIAIAFWSVVVLVLAILQFALHMHGEGLKSLKTMLPQTPIEMLLWAAMSASAGFCEEAVFRGYLQRQMFSLAGNAWVAAVLQALAFGWVHLYQGAKSAMVITVYGALFGFLAVMRKSLRPGMIQHAGQDTFAGIVGSLLIKHKII